MEKGIKLNSQLQMKGKTAKNRIAVLPTEGNDGLPGGSPGDRTIGRYRKYAGGGAGVVFSEAVTVDYEGGRARTNQLCLRDSTVDGFESLVEAIRNENPDTLFILQLDHAGSLSDPAFSKVPCVYEKQGATLLSDDEIESIRDMFVRAIVLAGEAGADGVDLKFSHGFFLNELVHPRNTRDGKYGGSFENRTRFLREIVEGVGKTVDLDDFLFGMRISVWEGIPGGSGTAGPDEVIEDLSEPVEFARLGEKLGLSFISVSAGNAAGNLEILLPTPSSFTAVYKHFGWQQAIKKAVSIPVIGAGYSYLGNGDNALPGDLAEERSFLYWAEKNLSDGVVDLVGIGRQAIADAAFPAKVLAGEPDKINYCQICGSCGALLGANKHIGCVQYDAYYRGLFTAQ